MDEVIIMLCKGAYFKKPCNFRSLQILTLVQKFIIFQFFSSWLKKSCLKPLCILSISSQVVIVKLKMDKDRKKILERKARSRADADKGKGKHTEESVAMATD